jgi:flagellar hook-basal body complex protein FliE
MSVTLANVAATYAQMQKAAVAPGMEARSAGASDFSKLVSEAAEATVNTMKQGEAASVLGLAGKIDLSQVVTAVSNAEVTLQAAVAVRDKVVQSYLEILRMPI